MVRSVRDFALWIFGALVGLIAYNWYGDRAWFVLVGLLALAVPWDLAAHHAWHGIIEAQEWYEEHRRERRDREWLEAHTVYARGWQNETVDARESREAGEEV